MNDTSMPNASDEALQLKTYHNCIKTEDQEQYTLEFNLNSDSGEALEREHLTLRFDHRFTYRENAPSPVTHDLVLEYKGVQISRVEIGRYDEIKYGEVAYRDGVLTVPVSDASGNVGCITIH